MNRNELSIKTYNSELIICLLVMMGDCLVFLFLERRHVLLLFQCAKLGIDWMPSSPQNFFMMFWLWHTSFRKQDRNPDLFCVATPLWVQCIVIICFRLYYTALGGKCMRKLAKSHKRVMFGLKLKREQHITMFGIYRMVLNGGLEKRQRMFWNSNKNCPKAPLHITTKKLYAF